MIITFLHSKGTSHARSSGQAKLMLHLLCVDLPASERDDRAERSGQLLLQLRDHQSEVRQRLLHRQQAHLGRAEGVFAKRQRAAIVPLRGG